MPIKPERLREHDAAITRLVGDGPGWLRDHHGRPWWDEPATFGAPLDCIHAAQLKLGEFIEDPTVLPKLSAAMGRRNVMHKLRRLGVVMAMWPRLRRMDIKSKVVLQHDKQTDTWDGIPALDTYRAGCLRARRGQRCDADWVDSGYLTKHRQYKLDDEGRHKGRVAKEVINQQLIEDLGCGMKLWRDEKRIDRERREARREPPPPADPTPADDAAALDTARARRKSLAEARRITGAREPPTKDPPTTS